MVETTQILSQSIAVSPAIEELIQKISEWIYPLGYRVVHLETQTHHAKTIRLYIDFLETDSIKPKSPIGIEDCVTVSRALEEPLETLSLTNTLLQGPYELEVSSPGVYRPLRTTKDFSTFRGERIRAHTFRPLSGDELGNPSYQTRNPKQKNFIGTLVGIQESKICMAVSMEGTSSVEITLPLSLISKANLEPELKFEGTNERE